ncbi:hypothetical protein M2351_001543 [Azospirillum canadense]|nr:hypothetical protein [Azospirillum canadense]
MIAHLAQYPYRMRLRQTIGPLMILPAMRRAAEPVVEKNRRESKKALARLGEPDI